MERSMERKPNSLSLHSMLVREREGGLDGGRERRALLALANPYTHARTHTQGAYTAPGRATLTTFRNFVKFMCLSPQKTGGAERG